MTYAGAHNVLTKASYSGTTTDANGDPVAQTDTSGGVYGSITFTDDTNLTGLTINGTTYTLVHSMSQLDALDGYDSAARHGDGHDPFRVLRHCREPGRCRYDVHERADRTLFRDSGWVGAYRQRSDDQRQGPLHHYPTAGLIGQTPNGATAVAVLGTSGWRRSILGQQEPCRILVGSFPPFHHQRALCHGAITSTGTLSGGLVGECGHQHDRYLLLLCRCGYHVYRGLPRHRKQGGWWATIPVR